jgi:hypothetical protein
MSRRLIGAVIVVGLVLAAFAAAALTMVPAGNLVKNPGAEGSPGGVAITQDLKPAGWTTAGGPDDRGITVMRYGTHAYFPAKAVAAAVGGGRNFFAGGEDIQVSTATQAIDVGAAASEIDQGRVTACLSGYLGGARRFPDTARVEIVFLAEDETALGQLRIGPVTAAQRNGLSTLLRRSAQRVVPANTRQLRVVLTAEHKGGGPNYGFADNIAVGLTSGSCEPVLAVKCVGKALVATVTPTTVAKVQRVRFAVKGGKRTKQANDARVPYSGRFTMAGLTGKLHVTATVTQANSGPITLKKPSPRC